MTAFVAQKFNKIKGAMRAVLARYSPPGKTGLHAELRVAQQDAIGLLQ
jgi:hypothetical protein